MENRTIHLYTAALLIVGCAGGNADPSASAGGVGDTGPQEGTASSGDGASGDDAETSGADGTGTGGWTAECQSQGTCGLGEACNGNEDCELGQCAGGICCDAACDGACESCSAQGLCGPTPAGQDPACTPECPGGGQCGGEPAWALGFGAPSEGESFDSAYDLAVDGEGNVYVVGSFQGSVDFGGGVLTSAGSDDIFLASYAPNGAHRWSHRYGSPNGDTAFAVDLTPGGDVVVGGHVRGDPGFKGNWPEVGLRAFVARFDAAGLLLASTSIDSDTQSRLLDLEVGLGGQVYATGGFQGELDLDVVHASVGDEDMYLVELDGALTPQWSWTHGGINGDLGRGVAVSDAGEIAVTGFFGDESVQDGSEIDVYAAKFSGPGTSPLWQQVYATGVAGKDKGHAVAFLPGGDVAVTGFYGTEIDFGLGVLSSTGDSEMFLARLSGADGSGVWAHSYGAAQPDASHALVVDLMGDIVIAGRFHDQVSFGGDPISSLDGQDVFVAKFADNGAHLWSRGYGGSGKENIWAAETDAAGNIYAAGHFTDAFDVGNPPLMSAEHADIFLMKLAP